MGRAKGIEILKEQFSESTRGHRKSLVVISAVAIFMSLTGLFPSEISAVGLKIGVTEKQIIIWGLIIAILYFLISFLVHFWPESILRDARIYSQFQKDDKENVNYPWQLALVSYAARNSIYIVFPLLISSMALVCLLWLSLFPDTISLLSKGTLWLARILSIVFMLYVFGILFMFTFEAIGSLRAIFRASRDTLNDKDG